MSKIIVCILLGFGVLLVVTSSSAKKIDDNFQSESKPEKSTGSLSLSSIIRQKRDYGHGGGGGGGGGGGHQSYGHGPGAGGGARGPVYFCGWVGSKMGSGGYGGGYGK